MPFEIMAIITAIAGCVLALRFIFAGRSLLNEWGLEPTDGALVITRRLGAMYLGLAVMFFLGRNAANLRPAICMGMAVSIALLAFLGFFELHARRVSRGVLVSAVVEVVLAAGFISAWWRA